MTKTKGSLLASLLPFMFGRGSSKLTDDERIHAINKEIEHNRMFRRESIPFKKKKKPYRPELKYYKGFFTVDGQKRTRTNRQENRTVTE
jgi:hypothetical protein